MVDRTAIVKAIETMPEEAFIYLLEALLPNDAPPYHAAVWPDELGGFKGATRASIAAVRAAATSYLERKRQ